MHKCISAGGLWQLTSNAAQYSGAFRKKSSQYREYILTNETFKGRVPSSKTTGHDTFDTIQSQILCQDSVTYSHQMNESIVKLWSTH